MSKTVSLTINGRIVAVTEGTSVFEAAGQAGIFIPHYCYHPDLSVAGVCRMCMVEVEKMPRTQISCNTIATQGMVVRTDTEKVKETVKGVLELHLINHPLDCPICDKAGECKLQDFYQSHGLYSSRMDYEKVHKPKVQDIGTIVLDSERCILCTRCVRFTDEVTHSNELGIFNRGDRSVLNTFDGGPLKNDYTGNLADICPVGALTAKDFRFQCRVWFLEKTETVCTFCARGCNTTVSVDPSTKKLYRVEPRRNPDVNRSWMCDTGRWEFHSVYKNRVPAPLRNEEGWKESRWSDALLEINENLSRGGALILLSTQLTNEEIVDSVRTYAAIGSCQFSWFVDEVAAKETAPYDGILKHRDLTANARGLVELSKRMPFTNLGLIEAKNRLKAGAFSSIFVIGVEGERMGGWTDFLSELAIPLFIHASNHQRFFERARWVLPNVTSFEKSGTVMNALGRIQRLERALSPQGLSRDAHHLAWGVKQKGDRIPLPSDHVRNLFDEFVRPLSGPDTSFEKFQPLGVPIHG